jgi:small-conductance mechanosensitive channel
MLPLARISELVQIEPMAVIIGLTCGAWLIYKIFLRQVSAERHRNLKKHFGNLFSHLAIASGLFIAYVVLTGFDTENEAVPIVASYIGLFVLLWVAIVFVKACRLWVFEYLFLSHMKVAFPLLLVNLFTLLLSVVIGGWLATELFHIQLVPLLATSAIFSIVLGLALQDTLGNLFAGVALQFDKPYEIGDWIEIENDGHKWVGQVEEISWRATVLIAFTEELITVPNRVLAQSRISNFSVKHRPIIRSQVYRLPFEVERDKAKAALRDAALATQGVAKSPVPLVFISESTESWLSFKLIYYVHQFGSQYFIADEINDKALAALEKAKIPLATSRIAVDRPNASDIHDGPTA